MKDKIISLENVSKKFFLSRQGDGLLGHFLPNFSSRKSAEEFWALKGINMEIEEGKVVGVIGRNGSGKTTLLNILAGISQPSEGKARIRGRTSSLLTVGAGFHNELTGKENIYLNASILGMSDREIREKFKDIVSFSELNGFIDVPIKTYSTGMQLRLGFSIATQVDFDILLVDEVISVGDVSFQKKCFEKIIEFKKQGKTMVIVTQAMEVVERLCDQAILLEGGKVEFQGDPEYVISRYLKLLEERSFSEVRRR
jgi:ABC-type polysaccharide/polyol phosphate transport system ATPase subunit